MRHLDGSRKCGLGESQLVAAEVAVAAEGAHIYGVCCRLVETCDGVGRCGCMYAVAAPFYDDAVSHASRITPSDIQ